MTGLGALRPLFAMDKSDVFMIGWAAAFVVGGAMRVSFWEGVACGSWACACVMMKLIVEGKR